MKQLKIAVTTLILILVVGLAGYFLYRHYKKQEPVETYKLELELAQTQGSGGYVPPSFIYLNSDAESVKTGENAFEITLTIFDENDTKLVYTHEHPEENEQNDCFFRCCYDEITSPETTGELVVGETYFAKVALKNENLSCESEQISFVFKSTTLHDFTYTLTKN